MKLNEKTFVFVNYRKNPTNANFARNLFLLLVTSNLICIFTMEVGHTDVTFATEVLAK